VAIAATEHDPTWRHLLAPIWQRPLAASWNSLDLSSYSRIIGMCHPRVRTRVNPHLEELSPSCKFYYSFQFVRERFRGSSAFVEQLRTHIRATCAHVRHVSATWREYFVCTSQSDLGKRALSGRSPLPQYVLTLPLWVRVETGECAPRVVGWRSAAAAAVRGDAFTARTGGSGWGCPAGERWAVCVLSWCR